jgi:D-glutamate N-acetyltransferase
MFGAHTKRMVLLAEGRLSSIGLRMVIAALLYIPEQVVAVIDSTKSKSTTQEAIGIGGNTPIVHTLEEALAYNPDSMLIGITPLGGVIPENWMHLIGDALKAKLHIISGLQQMLAHDETLHGLAKEYGANIYDLRSVPHSHLIRAQGSFRMRSAKTILTVGTDSNTGKMTTALKMYLEMKSRDLRVALVGTGPTGIMISGHGVNVESVGSDFLTGAVEYEIDKAVNEGAEYVIVEGQGAITNCGNSPIALGILHGTMPDAMVLCHQPARKTDGYGMALPSLRTSIDLHEHVMGSFKESKVVGIGLNTMDLNKEEVRQISESVSKELSIPAVDPMRNSPTVLVDALLEFYKTYNSSYNGETFVKVYDRIF